MTTRDNEPCVANAFLKIDEVDKLVHSTYYGDPGTLTMTYIL